jgi:plastocyanin
MALVPIFSAIRIIPRDEGYLDRKSGSRGEIYLDADNQTLRIYNGSTPGGAALAKADLANVTNSAFREKSVESKLATVIYTVTIEGPQAPDVGNKYVLNGVYRPIPNFVVGYTYVFNQDDATNVYFPNANGTTVNRHPLNFSADNISGERGGGTSYVADVQYSLNGAVVTQAVYNSSAFDTATARRVQITITNATPSTLYYWCYNHVLMGNEIAVADPGSGTGVGGGIVSLTAGLGISVAETEGVGTITNTGVLSIVAGSGITTSVDAGAVTINAAAATTGDITFTGTTIDSVGSAEITFTPAVSFDGDVTVGDELVFADGTRQSTATLVGPEGPEGPPGPTGSGAGDVSSIGGGYVDNALVRYNGTSGTSIQTSLASINDAGTLSATAFSGSGTSLTALNATNLGSGTVPNARFPATLPAASGINLTALNATNLGSGTIPDARFPATLPTASGVNLTALNATNLGSGTVPDARFPATLPAASGINLTALNATNLGSGTVPVLRLGDSGTRDATTYLRGDNTWATVAGGGGGTSDSFATISVAGQSDVVADSATDTLTLVAGTGITITTDAGADSITITNSGSVQNTFTTVAVAGQSNVIADSSTDTLTLAAGTGISITTDGGTDTVTITSTVAAGATAFTGLSDASSASLTVDQIYLPAITMLNVTNNGASSYRFDQYGAAGNPTVYAINGTTIAFNLNVAGHPFLIQTSGGSNYDTGLTHVTTGGTVSSGSSAQGQTSGTLYWKVPTSITGNYRYICSIHAGMVGVITIKAFSALP